jgi:hypothetical protein
MTRSGIHRKDAIGSNEEIRKQNKILFPDPRTNQLIKKGGRSMDSIPCYRTHVSWK